MAITNPFKKMPKWAIYTSIAGGVIIAGYAEYKHHESTGSWSPLAAAPSASTSATTSVNTPGEVTDPTTGTSYSDTAIDPVTQMTYASEISEFGSVASAEADVSQYGTTGITGSETYDSDYVGAQSQDLTTTTSGQTVYTSNSAWAQAVQAGLEDISGTTTYDGVDIGTTLGMYLQGEPLTSAEAGLIGTATAEYGQPPQGAPPITTVPTTTASTTPAATHYAAPSGMSDTPLPGGTSVDLGWTPVAGATNYHYQVLKGGDVSADQVTSTTHSVRVTGLTPSTTYTWRVSVDPNGTWSPQKSFTTTAK